jgi:GTP-binding protein Era
MLPFDETYFVSAQTGDGVPELKAALAARCPKAVAFPRGPGLRHATERMIAAEVTREQLYLQLHAELPYASAVETEKYSRSARRIGRDPPADPRRARDPARDRARQGRQPDQGNRRRARAELSRIMGVPVHLYLHVKVNPKWEEDRFALSRDRARLGSSPS